MAATSPRPGRGMPREGRRVWGGGDWCGDGGREWVCWPWRIRRAIRLDRRKEILDMC